MRHGAHSERELLSPGMRVLIRGQEWLVDKVEPNSLATMPFHAPVSPLWCGT